MNDLQSRVGALSPERLELLGRRLARLDGGGCRRDGVPEPSAGLPSATPQLPTESDPEALLAIVDELTDAHVDALLGQMLGQTHATPVQSVAPERRHEDVDRYSDDEVDSLLVAMLAGHHNPTP